MQVWGASTAFAVAVALAKVAAEMLALSLCG